MASPGVRRSDPVVVVRYRMRAGSFPEIGGPHGSFPALESIRLEYPVLSPESALSAYVLPSHASLFTAQDPSEHGILAERRMQYGWTLPTVAGALPEAGYATFGLNTNGLPYPVFAASGSYEPYRAAERWEKTSRWIPPESLDPVMNQGPRGGNL